MAATDDSVDRFGRRLEGTNDGVHKMMPGTFLVRLPVHGRHLVATQIADMRRRLIDDCRSAFDKDMRGDRLGFSSMWNGIVRFELHWNAPDPERAPLIGAQIPCIVSQVLDMECLYCMGDIPTKSAVTDDGDTTEEETS